MWLPNVLLMYAWGVGGAHKPLPAFARAFAGDDWVHADMWGPHVLFVLNRIADRLFRHVPEWQAEAGRLSYNGLTDCRAMSGYSAAMSVLLRPLQTLTEGPGQASTSTTPASSTKREYKCMCHDGRGGDGFKCHDNGYLKVYLGRGKGYEYGHRVICWVFRGPPGWDELGRPEEVGHTCNNARCWSPMHLRWVTHADNIAGRVPKW